MLFCAKTAVQGSANSFVFFCFVEFGRHIGKFLARPPPPPPPPLYTRKRPDGFRFSEVHVLLCVLFIREVYAGKAWSETSREVDAGRRRVGVALRGCALLSSGSLSWTNKSDEATAVVYFLSPKELYNRCRFVPHVRPRERTAAQQRAPA